MAEQDQSAVKLIAKPPHHTESGFQNHPLVATASSKGFLFYLRRFKNSVLLTDVPKDHVLSGSAVWTQFNSIKGNRLTWLGHASFLITLDGKNILTDPFLTEFASPLSWAGPRRYAPPGIALSQLPRIDFILISHNHYDHLDDKTIMALKNKASIQVLVPLGLKAFFIERGYSNSNITELDWHEQITIDTLNFRALPAVHDSARGLNDHNQTLWASWMIKNKTKKLYFIGDSGYSPTIFQEVGDKHGPFDFAFLPIGAYEPQKLMWMSHVNPEEAVTIGREIRAKTLVASHWGTINLSDEPAWEPPARFIEAGIDKEYKKQMLWVLKIGESRPL